MTNLWQIVLCKAQYLKLLYHGFETAYQKDFKCPVALASEQKTWDWAHTPLKQLKLLTKVLTKTVVKCQYTSYQTCFSLVHSFHVWAPDITTTAGQGIRPFNLIKCLSAEILNLTSHSLLFSLCLNALKNPNGSNCYQTFLQTLTDFVKTVVSWFPHWLCIDALMASFNIFVKPNLFPVSFVPFWWEMFQFIYYEGETMVKSS